MAVCLLGSNSLHPTYGCVICRITGAVEACHQGSALGTWSHIIFQVFYICHVWLTSAPNLGRVKPTSGLGDRCRVLVLLSHWPRTWHILAIPPLATRPDVFPGILSPTCGCSSHFGLLRFFQVSFFPGPATPQDPTPTFYFPVLYKNGTFIL